MNIYDIFDKNEIKLIEKTVKLENKDYTKDETKLIESSIIEDIFCRSSKNGDIQKANQEYSNILEKLQKLCN